MGTSARRRSNTAAATTTIEITPTTIESTTVKIPSWHFGLTDEVLAQAEALDTEAKQQANDAATKLYRMGQIALEMQNLLPHGNYEGWIRDFTGYSRSTLFAWRSVAETLPNLGESELKQIVPSALLQLGAKNTPDEVRQEALERMQSGETLSMADVKGMKGQGSSGGSASAGSGSQGGAAQSSGSTSSNQGESSQSDRAPEHSEQSSESASTETAEKRQRVANDYYPTPDGVVRALIDNVSIEGQVFEPCAGHGAISKFFYGCITNEPYPTDDFESDYQGDASTPEFWMMFEEMGGTDWSVSNTPYDTEIMMNIIQQAWQHSRVGVAFLLRLSFLEPCADRALWLQENADHLRKVIPVNPRPPFRKDTSGSDQLTVAWFVYDKTWSWKAKGIDCPFTFVTNWKSA